MSLIHQKQFYGTSGSAALIPNVFIGGLGITDNTPALLANRFSILEEDIQLFSVDVNNNISCSINVNYALNTATFNVNANITYFIDLGGFLHGLGQFSFNYCTKLIFFYGKNSIVNGSTSASRNFRNTKLKTIYVPLSTQMGYTSGDNQVFLITPGGFSLFCNPILETINAGGRDADIAYAEDVKLSTIIYCVDITSKPDAVNDLTAGVKAATTIELIFSAPSSTNALLKYEVWVDGAFWDWIDASGGIVENLSTGITYDIQVKPADIYYNIAAQLSNKITVTTL